VVSKGRSPSRFSVLLEPRWRILNKVALSIYNLVFQELFSIKFALCEMSKITTFRVVQCALYARTGALRSKGGSCGVGSCTEYKGIISFQAYTTFSPCDDTISSES
jgi:hypothetical protein